MGEWRPVALVCSEAFPVRGVELAGELGGVLDVERLVVSCCGEERGEHAADGPVAWPSEPVGATQLFEVFDGRRGAVEYVGDLGDVFIAEREGRHRGDRPGHIDTRHLVRITSLVDMNAVPPPVSLRRVRRSGLCAPAGSDRRLFWPELAHL